MEADKITSQSVCVSPPLITFEPYDGFGRHLYGDDAVEGNLDAIAFNIITLNILKQLRSKFLR